MCERQDKSEITQEPDKGQDKSDITQEQDRGVPTPVLRKNSIPLGLAVATGSRPIAVAP